jgi:hypothetical protein
MSTQREKFELFTRLKSLGFTYEESQSLRRIEMTLRRWFEAECGTDRGHVEREGGEEDGRPMFHPSGLHVGNTWYEPKPYPIADREAGARRRLAAIVKARNLRRSPTEFMQANAQDWVIPYVQTDPRGAALHLLTRADIRPGEDIGSIYNRGVCVSA